MMMDAQEAINNLIDQFDPERGITIGTLIANATKNGWHPSSPFRDITDIEPPAPKESAVSKKYKFLNRNELMALPKLKWRVKHVLPNRGIAAIYGPSGSGKSFLAIDLAASICLGDDWFGKRCNAAPVVYFGLEGSAGIQNRAKAWELARGKQLPPNFQTVLDALDLTNDANLKDIAAQTPKGAVVIIDTLNRATHGKDENSSSDMGLILAALKQLEHAIEGLVLIVHHTGKDQGRGLRGHSSLHAALDAAIAVKKYETHKKWTLAKSKDGDDEVSFDFRLRPHLIGKDEDGSPETSCTVESATSVRSPNPEPKGRQQKPAYAAIKATISSSSVCGKGGAPSHTSCISLDSAVTAIKNTLVTVDQSKRSNRAKEIIETFVSGPFLTSGLDEKGDSWYWLPE